MNDEPNNLKRWIEEASEGEPIEAVVIGEASFYYKEHIPYYDTQPIYSVLTWNEAQKWLDYDFDGDYCNPVYAWTKSWVIFVDQYDSSKSPCRIPRNPIDCKPYFPGGG